MNRVVITGMGIITSLGKNVEEFWDSICAGKDGVGEITTCDLEEFTYKQGGEIKDIPQLPVFPKGLNDRASLLALTAVNEAWGNAGLESGRGVGVVLATNFGSIRSVESGLGGRDTPFNGELAFSDTVKIVSQAFDCSGPSVSISLSCSSGAGAIGYGADLIRYGRAKAVVAGGYDTISRFCWSGLGVLRTMSTDKIRPFDKERSGTLFSEGAGVVILEDYDSAVARKANILAEVGGFGYNNNAFHITAPAKEGKGLADAMQIALNDANIKPEEIDFVNSHGTGTKYNDLTETQAIKTVFGEHASKVTVTSIKSMTGHLMGAAGSVEVISAVKTILEGKIPPTINMREQDPECDLNIPKRTINKQVDTLLTNSSGIGGNNVSLLIKKVGG